MSTEAVVKAPAKPDQRRDAAPRQQDRLAGPTAPIQELLPPLRWLLQPNTDRFAHPAEIELARLLTFYDIRWAYEPTTFAIRWGGHGRPVEFVTPDFYLPDHDLYLELTTMRQRLVTRKNRKFRLLREHYPNVRVRMLYLRDFQRLRHAFGSSTGGDIRVGTTRFAARDVEEQIAELASRLVVRWTATAGHDLGTRPLLLGAGPGCGRFLTALGARVRDLGVAIDVDSIELSTPEEGSAQRVKVVRAPAASVAGRMVVLAQEVLSTGLSAAFLIAWLRRHGAATIDVCALLDREAARVVDVPLACRGFVAPDVALAGFGLGRWRQLGDLPYIAEVETR
jgi:hypoxanthine phosphoribosyltransferase